MLAGVVDRLIPLQTWLFPSQVLLELDDHFVTLLALHHQGSIPTVKWLERVPLPAGTCEQGIPVRTEALADFIGDFPDLCADLTNPALDADPDRGYPVGQALAADLRRAGHRGLIYPSVRHKNGRCFVAFDPSAVQNVRPGASWMLEWNGGPEFSVIGL